MRHRVVSVLIVIVLATLGGVLTAQAIQEPAYADRRGVSAADRSRDSGWGDYLRRIVDGLSHYR